MAPTLRIQTMAQRAGRLKSCITRVIDGSKQVLEYVDQWEADRKAACRAAEQENKGHPNPDLAVTTDALNTLLSMETQLDGLPQILRDKATKLVKEAEEDNEEWEELENLCKIAVEEREDQRKHLLITIRAKIEMFQDLHEASEEQVPPPPLSPQQVLHIMAESIDAPNQEPLVTSPMKFPLYHELIMANSAETNGTSVLSPDDLQLPTSIQNVYVDGTHEMNSRIPETPILNGTIPTNPELGGNTNQQVDGRQRIQQNRVDTHNSAATDRNHLTFQSPAGQVRVGNRLISEFNRRNSSAEIPSTRLNNGYPNFEYNEEDIQRQYQSRNINGNFYSDYNRHQRQSRLENQYNPNYQGYSNQYYNEHSHAYTSQRSGDTMPAPANKCEVCNGNHKISVCTADEEMIARVCIENGKCPKCRVGRHSIQECPIFYLLDKQTKNDENVNAETRQQNRHSNQEYQEHDRTSSQQQRQNTQTQYSERRKEISERDLARHVATIKPFTGIVSEYASFRNIMTDYLESETISLAVRRDTLMQKISGDAAVQKSILNDPGRAIETTMRNLDRTYKRNDSTSVRNQFEKIIVSDDSIDTFIKSLALSRSLHDKVLEEEPHGFEYHSTKALLGRMPDAVRAMCNKMLRNETLTTEKIYEKAEEHLENQIEDAEITGRSANQTIKKWKTELHVTQSETDSKEEEDKESDDENSADVFAFGARREKSKSQNTKSSHFQQAKGDQVGSEIHNSPKLSQTTQSQLPAQSQNQQYMGAQTPYQTNMLTQNQIPQTQQNNNQLNPYSHQHIQYPLQMNLNQNHIPSQPPAPTSTNFWNPQPSNINYYANPPPHQQFFPNQQYNGSNRNMNQSQDPRNHTQQTGYNPVPQSNNSPASFGQRQQRSNNAAWFKENGSPPSVGHSTGTQLSIQEEAMKPLTDCQNPERYNLGPGPNIALMRYTFPREYEEESYCQICGKGHKLVRCLLSSSNVRKWIDEKKACSNCASRTHNVTECISQVSCFYCCGRHHTAACKLKEAYRDYRNYPPSAATPNGIEFFRDQQH